jgi:hypothetical protein
MSEEATHRNRAELGAGITVHQWPHDADGQPMAIVIGSGSDLIPTVQYGNVLVGPVTIMRPVSNDPALLIEEAAFVQDAAAYVVATRRRLLQYALDPSSRVEHPMTGEAFDPASATAGTATPMSSPAEPQVEPAAPAAAPSGAPAAAPAAAPAPAPNGSAPTASVG